MSRLMYVSEVAPEALMHLMMLLAANMEGLLTVVMTDECLGSSLDCCLNTFWMLCKLLTC